MPQKLLKFKNHEVHSITTFFEGKTNANIAIWVMQTAMGGKFLTVALDKEDYTLELVKKSGMLNVNFLLVGQEKYISRLGRKSGRDIDKLAKIDHNLDERGCPFLRHTAGYIQCKVHSYADSYDHELVICEVLKQVSFPTEKELLTHHYLREKGLVRG